MFQAFYKHFHFIFATILGGKDFVFPHLQMKNGGSERFGNFLKVTEQSSDVAASKLTPELVHNTCILTASHF